MHVLGSKSLSISKLINGSKQCLKNYENIPKIGGNYIRLKIQSLIYLDRDS